MKKIVAIKYKDSNAESNISRKKEEVLELETERGTNIVTNFLNI